MAVLLLFSKTTLIVLWFCCSLPAAIVVIAFQPSPSSCCWKAAAATALYRRRRHCVPRSLPPSSSAFFSTSSAAPDASSSNGQNLGDEPTIILDTAARTSSINHNRRRTIMMGPFLTGIATILWSASPRQGVGATVTTAAPPPSSPATTPPPPPPPEFATSAGRRDCTTISDPAKTVVTCTGGLMGTDGRRLRSIASTENGISTSAIRNPTAYSSPWSYLSATSDANKAWRALTEAVATLPDCQIITVRSADDNDTMPYYYLHATVPTRNLPPNLVVVNGGDGAAAALDDLEFILRKDESLVLYRTASRTSVFVYPLIRPIGDGGSHRRRLDALRETLGWIEIQ